MNKYHNQKILEDGVIFDSLGERDHYLDLRLREFAGEIEDLRVHPVYQLQPGFRHCGKWYPPITYEADFVYFDVQAGHEIVEDWKGFATDVFRLKMKLLLCEHPDIDFRVIGEPPKKRRRDVIAKRFRGRILSDTGK